MLECWDEDPKVRPSFSDLRDTFEGLMSENEGYIDFDEINEDSIYYRVPSFNSYGDDKVGMLEGRDTSENGNVEASNCQTTEFDEVGWRELSSIKSFWDREIWIC